MSDFVRHEPCPDCNSRDNVGVWADGHKYCFGCGWYESGGVMNRLQNLKEKKKNNNGPITLPLDCSDNLSSVALEWLDKYEITYEDIRKHRFKWSPNREQLIMPVYDSMDNLLMYQARNFGPDSDKKKYHTEGKPESILHILGTENESEPRITVVEDMISAIKLSKVTTVMPLFGSNLTKEKMARLSNIYNVLTIWLDHDKFIYAIRQSDWIKPLFEYVHVINKVKDPKEYSLNEIKAIYHGLT